MCSACFGSASAVFLAPRLESPEGAPNYPTISGETKPYGSRDFWDSFPPVEWDRRLWRVYTCAACEDAAEWNQAIVVPGGSEPGHRTLSPSAPAATVVMTATTGR